MLSKHTSGRQITATPTLQLAEDELFKVTNTTLIFDMGYRCSVTYIIPYFILQSYFHPWPPRSGSSMKAVIKTS